MNRTNLKPFDQYGTPYTWTYELVTNNSTAYPGFFLVLRACEAIVLDTEIVNAMRHGLDGTRDYWLAVRKMRDERNWHTVVGTGVALTTFRIEWRYAAHGNSDVPNYYGPFVDLHGSVKPDALAEVSAILLTLAKAVKRDYVSHGYSLESALGNLDDVLDTLKRLKVPAVTVLPTDNELGTGTCQWTRGFRTLTRKELAESPVRTLRMMATDAELAASRARTDADVARGIGMWEASE